MRSRFARGAAAALGLLLAGGTGQAVATPTQPHWRVPVTIRTSQHVADSGFVAATARSASDIWAVGAIGTYTAQGSERSDSLVEHFDGTAWHRHSAPPAPAGSRTEVTLTSVETAPGAPLWVAGFADFGAQADQGGFVARWTGNRWAEHAFGSGMDIAHVAVLSARNVWVLGQDENHNPATAFAARWNGRQWSTMPLAALPTFENESDVAADWAPAENPETFAPELLHLYGDHWSLVPTPSIRLPKGARDYRLNDVLDDHGDVLLTVGYSGDESIAPGLTLYRRSGTSWQRVAFLPKQAPAGMTPDAARGVWLLSSGLQAGASLLHVGPGGRVLRHVQPPRTRHGRLGIEGIAHVPGTASLVAAGVFLVGDHDLAAIGRYRP